MTAPTDPRQFVKRIDNGEVIYQQVGFQELDFGAVFGGKTRSSTQNTIGFGLQTFVLDVDDGKIVEGCTVQVVALGTDCFQYGIVASKDTDFEPAQITVAVTLVSPLSCTSQDWEIQIVGMPVGDANAVFVGTSDTTHNLNETSTDLLSWDTQPGKAFSYGQPIRFTALDAPDRGMLGIVYSYDSVTGALEAYCGRRFGWDGISSEAYSVWLLQADMAPFAQGGFDADNNPNLDFTVSHPVFWYVGFQDYYSGPGPLGGSTPTTWLGIANPTTGFLIFTIDGATNVEFTGDASIEGTNTGDETAAGILTKIKTVDGSGSGLDADLLDGQSSAYYLAAGDFTAANVLTLIKTVDGAASGLDADLLDGISSAGFTQLAFKTVAVAGQSDIVAEAVDDTLTIVGAGGIVITTTAGSDTLTFTGPNLTSYATLSFSTISVSGQSDVVADSKTDTLTLAAGTNITITTNAGSDTITIAASGGSAASQATMEAATDTTDFVTAGRQHFHPGHPKAIFSGSFVYGANVTGNISAVDTGTEIITWSVAHGRSSGASVSPNGGTWPTGSTLNAVYYLNCPSSTTFSLHLTYEDAIAGTNKVNLTAAGSGTRTMAPVSVTVNHTFGLDATLPIRLTTASATPSAFAKYATALSAANKSVILFNTVNIPGADLVVSAVVGQTPALPCLAAASWSASNNLSFYFIVWGDL